MPDGPSKRTGGGGRGRSDASNAGNDGTDEHGVEQVATIPDEPRIGTALIAGSTFDIRPVVYLEVNGMAVVEGDIALGTVEEVERSTAALRDQSAQGVARGVGITGQQFRWPDCRVPYEIDANLPSQQRVTDAIAHWESSTEFRFVVRTTEPNWVFFTDDGGCWSLVGMRGGRQTISLGPNCSKGNTIHEIGHAIGLWHEQSREDRDQFVTINWQNIQAGMQSQFAQHITDGDDLGAYDYGSIMHYPRTAFSANGQETITPVDANAQIGQRTALSPGDIGAVRAMYPLCHRIVKSPWKEPGTKVLRDPNRFKKILDDERLLKVIRDAHKPPRDPGPIKLLGYDVGLPGIGSVINPNPGGGLLPFAIATPHHAPLGGQSDEDAAAEAAVSITETLQAQLLEVEAAIGRAQAASAEAGLELSRLQAIRAAIAEGYGDAIADL